MGALGFFLSEAVTVGVFTLQKKFMALELVLRRVVLLVAELWLVATSVSAAVPPQMLPLVACRVRSHVRDACRIDSQ